MGILKHRIRLTTLTNIPGTRMKETMESRLNLPMTGITVMAYISSNAA